MSLIKRGIASENGSHRVFLYVNAPDALRGWVYDAADLFVMPNPKVKGELEGFGLVILEAGMHNIPVVASSVDGIPEAVLDGITGLLVPGADAQAFAKGIQSVLAWDTTPNKIQTAVETHYGWETLYRTIADIIGLPRH